MSDSTKLLPYIELWHQARSRGEDPAADQLGVDDPMLLAQLEHALQRLRHQSARQSSDTRPKDGTLVPEPSSQGVVVPPQADASLQGRMVGEYRLIEELGRGGMGVVYRAWDDRMARVVALKVILPHSSGDPNARKRFLREARAQGQIEHDNVIPIYHTGEDKGTLYIAMPLLVGDSLKEILETQGRLPLDYALLYGWQIADGLAAAHAKKVLHRDIKPGNVWVESTAEGEFRRIRILDFGLARPSATIDPHATVNRELLGTPAYMSPEQAGSGELDPRSDLFSLGVLLYEMVTGIQPFDDDNALTALMNVTSITPPTVEKLRPEVPKSFSKLIERLIEKRPDDRPNSAAEVAATIHELVVRQGVAIPAAIGSRIAIPSLPTVRSSASTMVPVTSNTGKNWDQRPDFGAWDVPPEPDAKPESTQRSGANRNGLWLVAVGAALCLGLGVLILAASLGWFPDTGTQAILDREEKLKADPIVPRKEPEVVAAKTPPVEGQKTMMVVLEGLPDNAEVKFPDGQPARPVPNARFAFTTEHGPLRVQLSAPGFDSREIHVDAPSSAANRIQVDAALRPLNAFTNHAGIRMKLIAPGSFTMGYTPDDEFGKKHNNNPPRPVTITKPYYIGEEEITVGQFRLFVESQQYQTEAETGSAIGQGYRYDPEMPRNFLHVDPQYNWLNTGYPISNDHPVVNVTWNDAKRFCEWLSKKEGRHYRLPSEAEWEFAARGPSQETLPFPEKEMDQYANIRKQVLIMNLFDLSPIVDPTLHSAAVGTFLPNQYGLYDTYGNVMELCEDWYSGKEDVTKLPEHDPIQSQRHPNGIKMARGGSFVSNAPFSLVLRYPVGRSQPFAYLGFRVLMELPETK